MKSFEKDSVRLDNSGYLSSQTKQQAIAALRAGTSVATVSRQTGVHIESVKRWHKEISNEEAT